MFSKVLIANRGEIALRVIRACRDLGIRSVAVFSEADRNMRYVSEADESVHIGPAPPMESYLSIDRIIVAAQHTGAEAIHPGYGFLSENAQFARRVEEAGLVFVGPPSSVIEAMGSKLSTRRLMTQAGIPILPGSDAARDLEEAKRHASEIGYPVLVKPSAGGGGRGMRVVENETDLAEAVRAAHREAGAAFGDSDVFIEKLLTQARHIEVQILADIHGTTIHLGDRDCSMQRRHQKVVEEAPAPGLTEAQHERVRSLGVRAAQTAGYVGAGTVEFLFDGVDDFYVLEINTRIQVEHGVTEITTGIDIVAEQFRIAAGEPLGIRQADVSLRGTAIECRLYAENPAANFVSSPGRIAAARFPSGPWVREDRSYEVGDEITPYYDGMINKLMVSGPSRDVAIARTLRALAEYRFVGISTNVAFLRWLVGTDAFAKIAYSTRFIEEQFKPENLAEERAFMPARATTAAARPAIPSAHAPAPPPVSTDTDEDHAMRAEVFVYHRRSTKPVSEYLIHVVPILGGGYQAIPVSPQNHRWAGIENCRTGWSTEEAVDNLIRGVLNNETPDEIFPELGMSY